MNSGASRETSPHDLPDRPKQHPTRANPAGPYELDLPKHPWKSSATTFRNLVGSTVARSKSISGFPRYSLNQEHLRLQREHPFSPRQHRSEETAGETRSRLQMPLEYRFSQASASSSFHGLSPPIGQPYATFQESHYPLALAQPNLCTNVSPVLDRHKYYHRNNPGFPQDVTIIV